MREGFQERELYPGEFPDDEIVSPSFLRHYEIDWNHRILIHTLKVYYAINQTEIIILQKLESEIERLMKLVRENHGDEYVNELRENWGFPRNLRHEINSADEIEAACDLMLVMGVNRRNKKKQS
ncbi:MAG TPA: hypothetical protein VF622_16240 [Segetibacter sp.]